LAPTGAAGVRERVRPDTTPFLGQIESPISTPRERAIARRQRRRAIVTATASPSVHDGGSPGVEVFDALAASSVNPLSRRAVGASGTDGSIIPNVRKRSKRFAEQPVLHERIASHGGSDGPADRRLQTAGRRQVCEAVTEVALASGQFA
jgi:hypothetical protein